MGGDETCCGGRAYEMGYQGELTKFAEHNTENWKSSSVKTIVTACSDCYQVFKVLYDKVGLKANVEILHITQYLDQLIKEGKLAFTKEIPMTVTYHDPCRLGRLAGISDVTSSDRSSVADNPDSGSWFSIAASLDRIRSAISSPNTVTIADSQRLTR